MLDELETDHEKGDYLQSLLIARATGEECSDRDFKALRSYFVDSQYKDVVPTWLKTKRSLGQYWQFIKGKFGSYAERRSFIYGEMQPLLDATEAGVVSPVEKTLDSLLENPSYESVNEYWQKCIERAPSDPEGAVTSAKALLESVLKHLAEDLRIEIVKRSPELPELYSLVAKELNLSPKDHSDKVIKGILSGCNAVVSGIGQLRNLHGDAHGKQRGVTRLETRHALLAVNLAGSMATFLIETANKALNSDI